MNSVTAGIENRHRLRALGLRYSGVVTFCGKTTVDVDLLVDENGTRHAEIEHPSLRRSERASVFRTNNVEMALQMARRIAEEGV